MNSSLKTQQTLDATLLAACADMAWWFGWSVQEIYELPINEFADWLDEANRQIRERYRKG